MLTLPSSVKIFVHTQPTDMRSGFDRLAMLAETVMQADPLSGHLFVFFNKPANKCKILFWDRTGFVLWYKRLEEGTFRLPRVRGEDASGELKASELAMMLEGIDLKSIKRGKRFAVATKEQNS